MAQLSYCASEMRRHDYDRYLVCLFAPAARREDLFALHAFNLELARTAEVVSEPMIGRIRLQWWRESLEGIFQGRPRSHAVVEALAAAVSAGGLCQDDLLALIDARELDLAEGAPTTLEALEDYGAGTSGQLFALGLRSLGVEDGGVLEAGRRLGTAWALLGILRAIPYHASRQRLLLPDALTTAEGLKPGRSAELPPSQELCRVVQRIAERAAEHLGAVRGAGTGLPKAQRSPFLLSVLARHDARILRAAGYDPFHATVQTRPPGRVWRLFWARLRGRY